MQKVEFKNAKIIGSQRAEQRIDTFLGETLFVKKIQKSNVL